MGEHPPPIAPKIELAGVTLNSPPATAHLDVGLTAPPVSLGDVFVYDDPPEQWTVTSIDGPYIGWTNSTGGLMQTAWTTLLPPLRWGGMDSTADVGQRKLTQLSGTFFPLKKGNRVTFLEEAVYARPGAVVNGYWQCDVRDQSEIVVPAGKAQVWEILCLLNGRERKLMYYDEKIGNVVRVASTGKGGVLIRQLTGYARAGGSVSAPAAGTAAKPSGLGK